MASARSSTPTARRREQRSAFAGLSANTLFYNTTLAAAMWLGRIIFVIPVLALAGSLAKKKIVPAGRAPSPPTPRCSPRC